MKLPIFLDFEASSLNLDSYPIEVAWSDENGEIESYLIRPEPEWTDWDDYAENEIHGISREQLFDEGMPAEWIVGRMQGKLKNKSIYADGGAFDEVWCERMFDYNGYYGRLPFRIEHFNDILAIDFNDWNRRNADKMQLIFKQARIAVGGRHRATVDVRYLIEVYRQVGLSVKGMSDE